MGLSIVWIKQNRSAGSQFETSEDCLGALKERWYGERAYIKKKSQSSTSLGIAGIAKWKNQSFFDYLFNVCLSRL